MAELIKSVKALGEAITGEKIEGDTLFAAVKDAGKKMTGKELEGKELNDIIAETAKAYEGGGSSLIEIPESSRITLNGNKLLQLLIAKGVDVDAELTVYGSAGHSGVLLGGVIDLNGYLDRSVTTHIIFPSNSSSTAYTVEWALDEYSYDLSVESTILGTVVTFKNMLSNIGELTMNVSGRTILVPYLAVTTSSNVDLTSYNITTEEFLSFITITPIPTDAE